MNFISRLFSKFPAQLLAKGDEYMNSDSYFDARVCYEDGLKLCMTKGTDEHLETVFIERIESANRKLAERNLYEAECAYSRDDIAKAVDHLELVKTLTYDPELREKAEILLRTYSLLNTPADEKSTASSCGSCGGGAVGECGDSAPSSDSLPQSEYYELLIQQLPADQHSRYAELGENFAYAYIAASHDEHQEALSGFERCFDSVPPDIYWYEKGKVLHRLSDDLEAEQCLRSAVQLNSENSLAWFSLALLLRENNRFQDALATIETMISANILPEQALLMRADISEATGDHDAAVNQYVELLQTSCARAAAERLYGLLMEMDRQSDAAVIFKKYLNKSCH